MGNGVSTDQGNLPYHGIRDVSDAADKKPHDWSQLAEAPITEQLLQVRLLGILYSNLEHKEQ